MMYKRLCGAVVAVCITLLIVLKSATANTHQNDSPLGTNLAPLSDYSGENAFVDIFKQSRPWRPRWEYGLPVNTPVPIYTDEDGWLTRIPPWSEYPGYDAISTYFFQDLNGRYPAGEYRLLYKGQGTIKYRGDAEFLYRYQSAGYTVEVIRVAEPGNGFELMITHITEGDYLRDMHLLMPGYDETNFRDQIFHPDFLASLDHYKVIRFMNWMNTNWLPHQSRSDVDFQTLSYEELVALRMEKGTLRRTSDADMEMRWEDRPKVSDARYTEEAGAPLETMLALAAELNIDPWFNMPHQMGLESESNINYLWNFAHMVHEALNETQRVYVEYSNEMWNYKFEQTNWADRQAAALWPGSTAGITEKRLNWYAYQSERICSVWKQTWGEDADRVICVLGAHAGDGGYRWSLEQLLECPLFPGDDCRDGIDAIAIAPYFGNGLSSGGNTGTLTRWATEPDGVSKVLHELRTGEAFGDGSAPSEVELAVQRMQNYATEVAAHGLDLVAYEGGQHLVSGDQQISDLFNNVNRDPGMLQLYDDYLNAWKAAGGKLFLHYYNTGVYSTYGSWGAQETYVSPSEERAKFTATKAFVDENPCWWPYCEFPDTLTVADIYIVPKTAFNLGLQEMPVRLRTNGADLHDLAFTLQYEPGQVWLELTDKNGDGMPDAIVSGVPPEYTLTVTHDPGFLYVHIAPRSNTSPRLNDITLLTVLVDVQASGGAGIWFANEMQSLTAFKPACLDSASELRPCETSGSLFERPPAAIRLGQLIVEPTSASLLLMGVFGLALLTMMHLRNRRPS